MLISCFCETRTINDKTQSTRNLCCKGQLYFQCLLFIIKSYKRGKILLTWAQLSRILSPLLRLTIKAKSASEILNNLNLLKTICNAQYNNFIMKDRQLSQTFRGSPSVHVYVTILWKVLVKLK